MGYAGSPCQIQFLSQCGAVARRPVTAKTPRPAKAARAVPADFRTSAEIPTQTVLEHRTRIGPTARITTVYFDSSAPEMKTAAGRSREGLGKGQARITAR
jgi:hypothetical protein